MKMKANPSEFIERIKTIATHLNTIDWPSCGLAVASICLILQVPKFVRRVPGSIAAMLAGAAAVALFHLPVETIGSRFGGLSGGLPPIHIPPFRADLILPLLPSAFTVAILAAVESLLSAVVADGLSGDRHNSNAELVAQGTANILVPLIGGIPVTGAIARTGTNFKSGAKTPVAGVIHSLTLLAVMLLFAPFAKFIPLATLAAVLFVVAYNIGEWREIPSILKLDTPARSVWLITFVLTVVADLTVAVEVGMALASLLYIYRISQTTTVAVVTPDYIEDGRPHVLQDKEVPPYVTILRIHGPFLFGTTDQLREETADLSGYAPVVIVRLRNMTALDATGLHELERLNDRLRKSGRTMLICGARRQPAQLLKRSDFIAHVGKEHILPHIQAALQHAERMHAGG
jgi:SulP family sulfate permease